METLDVNLDMRRMAFLGCTILSAVLATAGNMVLLPSDSTSCRARPGTQVREDAEGWLDLTCDGTYGWPGVELKPRDGTAWDFSRAGAVEVVVSNMGANVESISLDVFPKGAKNRDNLPCSSALVPPGECRLLSVRLADARVVTDAPVKLERMKGNVGVRRFGDKPPYQSVTAVEVFQCQPKNPHPIHFAVLSVRTAFEAVKPMVVAATNFFPFCDRYGQFRHTEWPGKIHSDEELREARRREEAWLDAHRDGPVPDVDRYGGWKGGPQLRATGFFRTEKVNDRWWLVDPDGHLFFSLGITCVYASTDSVVDGREKYFEWLPKELDECWDDKSLKVVNFMKLNQIRKYGDDWKSHFADMAHRRFHAWGINTVANWSHDYIWKLRRTPYVATIDFSSKTRLAITKKKRFGRHMPDVYSPQFADDIRERAEKLAGAIKDDPWCVGVFVDNELAWETPDDVADVAEKYFSTVAAAMKTALPNHLYLGCRFAWGGPDAWRAAARHCDVVSFNFYERRPTKDLPPDAVDKPIIVGEFHFGALDRGLLNTACAPTFDQEERAQCFKDYVNACLDNRRYVGCHWFQYSDQALTGRYDGENYQCGFVSVCDVPYPELVKACREIAAQMYPRHYDSM